MISRHDGPEVLVKEVMDQLGGQMRQRSFLKSGDSRKEVTLPEFMDEVMNRFEVSPELRAAVLAKNYKGRERIHQRRRTRRSVAGARAEARDDLQSHACGGAPRQVR